MFCNYIQWRLAAHLENGTPPTDRLSRHLRKCSPCRRQYEQLCRIDQQLKTRDADLPVFEDNILQEKILARLSISPSQSPVPLRPFRVFPIIPAAALAAVLLIGAGLWLFSLPRPKPDDLTRADLTRFNQLVNTEIAPLRSNLIRQSMHQPMEKELDNLTRDMEKAVRFITACLPRTQEQYGLSGQ